MSNPIFTLLASQILNGENFVKWKSNMNILLICENYHFILKEDCPPVPPANAARALTEPTTRLEQAPVDTRKTRTQTYELAEECLRINYYGARRTAETLIPFLQFSDSPRIVNVSSSVGKLQSISNDWAKTILSDAESLTEDRIDKALREFLKDFKEGSLESKGWPSFLSAYTVSKAALNAYTRVLAKKYPSFLINSVCPGFL
ncbi:hypothetical protein L484_006552 [Morus notabilis]|uniref:(+)-neomenthol dehydrogenase n=1 Tax=Morus notabilis TaxID=981085 RepID=W9S5C9_9ROSA|nr:hypothetical protein L484_006552 [Morus notabilis]